ncbi:MAG TPA: hypothetical protein VEX68_13365 [Bryobacteraceae bacterium]|nr:hypothetical protein [Bryobacteraceae bacterium]
MSQAATARSNGAKSNGPITPEGKAISAQNATKHGLTSSRVVLPHESQEAYDKLEASFTNRFKPADDLELELVQEMAAARWRLRRIQSMENALFKKAIQQHQAALGPDANSEDVNDAAYAEVAESKSYRMLVRHAAQLRRSYEKAWKELELIQEERHIQEDDEVQNEPSNRSLERRIDTLMAMPLPGQLKSTNCIPLREQHTPTVRV